MSVPDRKVWLDAQALYESGHSMREVGERLNISLDAVTYALRKLGVPRRSAQEANRLAFEKKPLSFTVRLAKNNLQKALEVAGVMLYWAEGHKAESAAGVDFANSDPAMVSLFVKFLRSRYILDEKRLRVLLYCYENQDQGALITFWSKLLDIPRSQFTKPYVRKQDHGFRREMKYGMVHIRYADKKMLNDLRNLIDSYVQRFR